VQGMASEDECMREVFFEITCWQGEELAVPLSQLIEVEETKEAIGGIVGLLKDINIEGSRSLLTLRAEL